jgi:hypothetical protein
LFPDGGLVWLIKSVMNNMRLVIKEVPGWNRFDETYISTVTEMTGELT